MIKPLVIRVLGAVFAAALVFVACSDQGSAPLEPSFNVNGTGCDLSDATSSGRRYFEDNGRGSLKSQALDLVSDMEDYCAAGDDDSYTAGFYQAAGFVEQAMDAMVDGDPVEGNTFLTTLLLATQASGALAFDPCDGAAACEPWDGYSSAGAPPDFTDPLGDLGTFAVITTGTNAVCSDHRNDCFINPAMGHAEGWGVEPSLDWETALHGRTTLLFGSDLEGAKSPTNEVLLSTPLAAYEFNLIPHPDEFAPDATPPAVLEVGLCSPVPATKEETLIQKNRTILEQATLGFCAAQELAAAPRDGVLAAFASVAKRFFDLRPRAVVATAFRAGPGGSAGSFTEFYATDLVREAELVFAPAPMDAEVGETVSFSVKARTPMPRMSPIENALVRLRIVNNNGIVPSGGEVTVDPSSTADLTCGGPTQAPNECFGYTQADEDPSPGTLDVDILVNKSGGYRICVTGELDPLDFGDEVCAPKINVRPAN
ncbi:MAG: hypothetical protein OEU54_14310 [Gemmatimonadota bacterium]|nr:hypothetical protein [Gemmatimonadota bacterium]